MNAKQIVREGYDLVSHAYRAEAFDAAHDYAGWIEDLCASLGPNPRILDLGCGCGVPVAQLLATRARVTGVDFSSVQIERARALVHGADFVCEDMCTVRFPAESFDAVVSFYAIIHVPLEEQRLLLQRIAGWLRIGGSFLATLGARAWTGAEEDWLGVEGATMCFSHADAATYRSWLETAGFSIISEAFVPEGEGGHQLFRARRTA